MASGEAIDRGFASLSASKRLARSMSQTWKRKGNKIESKKDEQMIVVSSRCGGCKVVAEEFGDCRRRLSASEAKDKLCRKNDMRLLKYNENRQNVHLPDDILEMCLVRVPFRTLMNARLVCKRWRSLTTTPRFVQMRREGAFQSPWLFIFGLVKDGFCSGEVHALDVSLNEWYKIESRAMKGKFRFSVIGAQDDIYVVGGCSSLANFGRVDLSSFKTHRGVLVFNPLTKSTRKAASMSCARSSPILGVSEVSPGFSVSKSQHNRTERRLYRSRIGGVSDIYEDPHRLSVRRRPVDENEASIFTTIKSCKATRQKNESSKKFVLIAVGGLGSWGEALDSGEIYDPVSNKWSDIPKLPLDFGIACSGVVCNCVFYVYSESDKLAGFDVEAGHWVEIRTMALPPRVHEYYPKLISCAGRLLMVSVSWCEGEGQIGRRNKAVRKVWELDVVQFKWSAVSVHPDAPMDWNAAFAADKDVIFGLEMFKIFGRMLEFATMLNVSEAETRWRHVSTNHETVDASSCFTKSIAVMHL